MAKLPFWDSEDDEEASQWDDCDLGGFHLPGICDVKVKAKRKLDVQEGSGTDYDTVADKGQRSADVKITCKVIERDEWDGWVNDVLPAIWPAGGKGKPQPLEIVHPITDIFRISAMVIQDIDADLSDDNIFTIVISGFAWGKPKPSPVKTADKAKGSEAKKADPNKAAEQAPFNPEASILDSAIKALDPDGKLAGKPRGQGAPSRDPKLLKP